MTGDEILNDQIALHFTEAQSEMALIGLFGG